MGICKQCRDGRHPACVDLTATADHASWVAAGGSAAVPWPTRHCVCQHAGSPVADDPGDRPVVYETTYPTRHDVDPLHRHPWPHGYEAPHQA